MKDSTREKTKRAFGTVKLPGTSKPLQLPTTIGGVLWISCRECHRVHPESAPHLAADDRRVRWWWSGTWPYLVASVVTRRTLAAAAATMRDRQEAEAMRFPSRCIDPIGARVRLRLHDASMPGLCRVLNATGQLIALIDPVTRQRVRVPA